MLVASLLGVGVYHSPRAVLYWAAPSVASVFVFGQLLAPLPDLHFRTMHNHDNDENDGGHHNGSADANAAASNTATAATTTAAAAAAAAPSSSSSSSLSSSLALVPGMLSSVAAAATSLVLGGKNEASAAGVAGAAGGAGTSSQGVPGKGQAADSCKFADMCVATCLFRACEGVYMSCAVPLLLQDDRYLFYDQTLISTLAAHTFFGSLVLLVAEVS
jgi:hypothetical protein